MATCVVCRYIQLLGIVPTDAVIEKRLGEMFDADGDKTEAFTYFYNVNNLILCAIIIIIIIIHRRAIMRYIYIQLYSPYMMVDKE